MAEAGHLWRDPRAIRIVIFAFLLAAFCLVEFSAGIYVGSLALLADSIHLLSDVLSMIIGLFAIKYGKQPANNKYTFGLIRFEILGGLANSCFLLAVCLFIVIEAIQRFISMSIDKEPMSKETNIIIYVGVVGFVLNGLGLFIFSGGHGHSHSHGVGSSHADEKPHQKEEDHHPHSHSHSHSHSDSHSHSHSDSHSHSHSQKHDHDEESPDNTHFEFVDAEVDDDTAPINSTRPVIRNINVQAIFLHIASDFLGSIGVITCGTLETYLTWEYRFYIDPAVSLLIAIFITISTVPILQATASIFLQAVPDEFSIPLVKRKLLQIQHVRQIGHINVWQLNETQLIASIQLRVSSEAEHLKVLEEAKDLLQRCGVHHSTVEIDAYVAKPASLSVAENEEESSTHVAHDLYDIADY